MAVAKICHETLQIQNASNSQLCLHDISAHVLVQVRMYSYMVIVIVILPN